MNVCVVFERSLDVLENMGLFPVTLSITEQSQGGIEQFLYENLGISHFFLNLHKAGYLATFKPFLIVLYFILKYTHSFSSSKREKSELSLT